MGWVGRVSRAHADGSANDADAVKGKVKIFEITSLRWTLSGGAELVRLPYIIYPQIQIPMQLIF